MPNYRQYMADKNITSAKLIKTLNPVYPGFSKIQSCMICNPDKYGVCLIPEAEDIIAEKYGYSSYLGTKPKASPKRKDNRKKKNRLTVRLTDETYNRVMDVMLAMKYKSTQDFLETLLNSVAIQFVRGEPLI